jgi:hypothetical protein
MVDQSQPDRLSTVAPAAVLSTNKRREPLVAYLDDGTKLVYRVAPDASIVAEWDYFYTLYAVAVTASDGRVSRHLLIVPSNVSAVSFDVGLALLEEDSAQVDAGNFKRVEQLASALKRDGKRYRTFSPPRELNRFCM